MTKNNNPLAVWSLVLGIVAMIFCGPISGIPAVICGHMARSKIKTEPDKWTGDGMALAGLIMGYLSIVILIILSILGIFAAIMIPSVIKMQQNNPPQSVMHQDQRASPSQTQFVSYLA